MSYCIYTFGCTYNQADSQKIETILHSYGFQKKKFIEAKLVLINTCAVKHTTEVKILNFIKEKAQFNSDKFYIIMGCLPQIDTFIHNQIQNDIRDIGVIINSNDLQEIITVINQKFAVHPESFEFQDFSTKSRIIPFIPDNCITAIIQISEGCNNNCTYCCTTIARGKLISFECDAIINQIEILLKQGIKEFLLTSQDCGNYQSNSQNLLGLLNKITQIPGKFFIRIGMINPEFLIHNLDSLLDLFHDDRMYRFLHIPIQSASDIILNKMSRNYSVKDVELIISKIKKFDPNFTFSTDIITGFPTESNEDHMMSLKFIQNWQPEVMNISKFSSRPNTAAKLMAQTDSQIIKQRSKEFHTLYQRYLPQKLHKWINWEGEILINEADSTKNYPYSGRNRYYVPIIVNKGNIGDFITVKLASILNHSLIGNHVKNMGFNTFT